MAKRGGWQRPPGASASGWTGATGADPAVGLMALANRVDKARRSALLAMGLIGERQIKVELSKPGRGRVYLRQTLRAEAGGRVRNTLSGRFASRKKLLRLDRQGRVRNAATGRFMTKSGKNRHVASRPGDPPAVDTGTLRASIGHEREDVRGSVRVGTANKYAPPLEFGTTTAGKSRKVTILPRPFVRPAMAKVKAAYNGVMIGELKRAGAAS
jgi:HK97 gp10 family phage protein